MDFCLSSASYGESTFLHQFFVDTADPAEGYISFNTKIYHNTNKIWYFLKENFYRNLKKDSWFLNFLILSYKRSNMMWDTLYLVRLYLKKLSLCHKYKFSNPEIFSTWLYKQSLDLLNLDYWPNRILSLKYRSLRHWVAYIWIQKSEFVANTQFLSRKGRQLLDSSYYF